MSAPPLSGARQCWPQRRLQNHNFNRETLLGVVVAVVVLCGLFTDYCLIQHRQTLAPVTKVLTRLSTPLAGEAQ